MFLDLRFGSYCAAILWPNLTLFDSLPALAGVAISFTYPSKVFLIEATTGFEIAFEIERALEYVPAGERADVKSRFEIRLYARNGKPAPRFD
jgi:hypothetical protein